MSKSEYVINGKLSKEWMELLDSELKADYFQEMMTFLEEEYKEKTIYPPNHQIFTAFSIPPKSIKVVILGQDPYHGEGQAHGLSFSVPHDVKIPKSLRNIFKELENDLKIPMQDHGNLEHWMKQGVFLLNASLTVEKSKPLSHKKIGWLKFTDFVISQISKTQDHIVFMLWGKFAQSKSELIDESKHLILKAPHPSPLSSYQGFFGCKHFSLANDYLIVNNKKPILW